MSAKITPEARVLNALRAHARPEQIADHANVSLLTCLRTLQSLETAGVVERYGRECWRKTTMQRTA